MCMKGGVINSKEKQGYSGRVLQSQMTKAALIMPLCRLLIQVLTSKFKTSFKTSQEVTPGVPHFKEFLVLQDGLDLREASSALSSCSTAVLSAAAAWEGLDLREASCLRISAKSNKKGRA